MQLNDPCLSVSEGTPVIFHGYPKDFDVAVTTPLCQGDCNGIIEIQSTGNGLLYQFGNGTPADANIFNGACSGIMSISVISEGGCSVDSTVIVTDPPLLQVDLGPDQIINIGDSVILTANTSSSVIQYFWFEASACLICPEITVFPSSSTIYEVEVSDMNGCTASDEVEIKVDNLIPIAKNVFVPDVFTPNNDGINDVFFPQGTDDLISINSFEIFDRWGNKIFELKNILPGDEGWDGTYRGQEVRPGVYVYLIRAVFSDGDEEILNGDITLIR